ncbi:ABC-2 type transport system permease protein [Limnobacter sp. 130]|jgi:ABC-2 type transport system permease protein|uniref:ABC transporter permease n=1 Tax=Limnobacter sp. 130 TaxID=2653147 RepID=UPI0012F15D8C|nr:ABC transporter permease [Limnobacter sp. 130]VWX36591.1 ABC-2 type transport system permease protein [Limnobacter sp. 130]
MSSFQAGLQRELSHLRRDKGDLFLTLGMMPVLFALIWWIFSAGQPTGLPVAIVDEDNTSISRQISRLIEATPGVKFERQYINVPSALDAIRTRDVFAVLVIPKGLERDVLGSKPGQVVLQLNSQYSTYSSTIQRNVTSAVLAAGVGIGIERLKMGGAFPDAAMSVAMPVSVNALPLFNEGPDYEVFLGATLIAALFHILAIIMSVTAVGRELRDGTAGEWLATSNGSLATALLSKILPYFLALNFYTLVFVVFFQNLAPDSYQGKLLSTWLTLIVMTVAAMAVGILVVAVTKNFRMALSVGGFYSAPAFAYSGQAFPLIAMPEAAQYWASILPLTHWLQLYNQMWIAGAPLVEAFRPFLIIAFMTVIAIVPAYLLLKRNAFEPANWGNR